MFMAWLAALTAHLGFEAIRGGAPNSQLVMEDTHGAQQAGCGSEAGE